MLCGTSLPAAVQDLENFPVIKKQLQAIHMQNLVRFHYEKQVFVSVSLLVTEIRSIFSSYIVSLFIRAGQVNYGPVF